jgi:hypothetical protein
LGIFLNYAKQLAKLGRTALSIDRFTGKVPLFNFLAEKSTW